ncbi:thermonuclease family protein [Neorhizobium sp. AL 9.2.2]|uniref:thermonuclease family protein n=1 Tax=Neorhizobium sp. AL 9.2.2 TaxID=2712894 RepID=UPI0015748548|nr:thermonuclease family protein [Neorhizobium sp. AL 9.2.2]NSY17286.1 thermonuclease family protein [Neorhizobium sp. AL 9.2.2]
MRFTTVTTIAILSWATPAGAIDICKGGNRAERRVTCVVDGDTLWQNGIKMRLLDIDTPETFEAQCDHEKHLGEKAKLRLQALMSKGYQLDDSGAKDRTSDRRNLVHVILPDGRDAGKVLISEGLAQQWPNKGNRWCNGLQGNGR